MKFYLTAVIAAILTTTAINAQHMNLGIKGGLNLYTINNDNGSEYDSKVGFHAGLIGHIHLTRQFAVQPELVYSAQGAKYTAGGIESELNLGYINIPVLLQYMFDNGFRLQAGPQLGFMINAKTEIGNTKADVKDNFKTVDFGLGAGVGYVHTASGFGIDARYNFGLSNINENDAVKSTNRGFQLGVFYLFKHK
jgi:hypothetical protein